MAIGFTPKHIETISLGELSPQQFLVFATEAIKRAGWDQTHLSAAGLIAYTNNGIMQWNAEVRIKIEMDSVTIQSASTGSDMIDLGKNKKRSGFF